MHIWNTMKETLESLHDAVIFYNVFFGRYVFYTNIPGSVGVLCLLIWRMEVCTCTHTDIL